MGNGGKLSDTPSRPVEEDEGRERWEGKAFITAQQANWTVTYLQMSGRSIEPVAGVGCKLINVEKCSFMTVTQLSAQAVSLTETICEH